MKIELSVCWLKIKKGVVYTVMRLIPWKQSHGSETSRPSARFLACELDPLYHLTYSEMLLF